MDYYRALRILALKNVLKPDEEYHLRTIMRWYSKTYHTPLHFVETIPIETLISTFYESKYEEMSEEEQQSELELLLETEEQRKKRIAQKDLAAVDDYEFFEMSKQQAKAVDKNAVKKGFDQLSEAMKEASKAIKDFNKKPEPSQEIDIKFVSDSEFEDMLNKTPEE